MSIFYPHCYVTWCPLTTGIVASQYPSSMDAMLVTRYLTPLISLPHEFKAVTKNSITIKHIYNESANKIEGNDVVLHESSEFPINDISDWHGDYGDKRLRSLHTGLLDVG